MGDLKMKVLEYRMLSRSDESDVTFRAWSRAYEYPLVIRTLHSLGLTSDARVHNTSCGSEAIHLQFAMRMENEVHAKFTHSDLFQSVSLPKYTTYDITRPWAWEKQDVVINISTVEHLPKDKRLTALQNLIDQLKPGGHLILTFDWPRVSNQEIERFFGAKMTDTPERLNGGNSKIRDPRYKHLNIIFLHVEK